MRIRSRQQINLLDTSQAGIWLLKSRGKVEITHFHLCHGYIHLFAVSPPVYFVAEENRSKTDQNKPKKAKWYPLAAQYLPTLEQGSHKAGELQICDSGTVRKMGKEPCTWCRFWIQNTPCFMRRGKALSFPLAPWHKAVRTNKSLPQWNCLHSVLETDPRGSMYLRDQPLWFF